MYRNMRLSSEAGWMNVISRLRVPMPYRNEEFQHQEYHTGQWRIATSAVRSPNALPNANPLITDYVPVCQTCQTVLSSDSEGPDEEDTGFCGGCRAARHAGGSSTLAHDSSAESSDSDLWTRILPLCNNQHSVHDGRTYLMVHMKLKSHRKK